MGALVLTFAPHLRAAEPDFVALTNKNQLLRFNAQTPSQVTTLAIKGVKGSLRGITTHPTQGVLYGLSSNHELYMLNVLTGMATSVSKLSIPVDGSGLAMDFNPTSARLRVISNKGQNLRVHVDLGAATTDGVPAYGAKDPNQGKSPKIVATAYTNALPQAATTQLFHLDSGLDRLVLQDPPNNGLLKTIGALGVDVGANAGFEIVSEAKENRAFALLGSKLYRLNLSTGQATAIGTLGTGDYTVLGLAALPKN